MPKDTITSFIKQQTPDRSLRAEIKSMAQDVVRAAKPKLKAAVIMAYRGYQEQKARKASRAKGLSTTAHHCVRELRENNGHGEGGTTVTGDCNDAEKEGQKGEGRASLEVGEPGRDGHELVEVADKGGSEGDQVKK